MLYPFISFPDGTEIVHSERISDEGDKQVKVQIEAPIEFGFKSATCWLPSYRWESIDGYSEKETYEMQCFLESVAHVIFELASDGGFEHAAVV